MGLDSTLYLTTYIEIKGVQLEKTHKWNGCLIHKEHHASFCNKCGEPSQEFRITKMQNISIWDLVELDILEEDEMCDGLMENSYTNDKYDTSTLILISNSRINKELNNIQYMEITLDMIQNSKDRFLDLHGENIRKISEKFGIDKINVKFGVVNCIS